MIRIILFDASDVLYSRKISSKAYAGKLLEEEGFRRQPSSKDWETLKTIENAATLGKAEYRDYWDTFLRIHGVPEGPQRERLLQKIVAQNHEVYPREGVPEALEELHRKGYILGVITDTIYPTEWKMNWLDTVGASPYLDIYVCSREAGVRKPDPAIYQIALEKANASPEETLFVGHAKHELDGAKQAGILTVAVFKDPGATGDYEIPTLKELCPLLESLSFPEPHQP